ncbi:hypothetical protein BO71DRAFT_373444 [Aspergillus ellipticus CBS 707.79]|uniref:Cora-domain-containing protein n=1 Tax=Aspergillus ellipticus CBS 707.79 TaxID=1448320 RepID=A0A319DIP3_9EURO|nr:hypothetical protein BO71DRAFT_373444 [Aspergillus ellipticus CBS 707.79]
MMESYRSYVEKQSRRYPSSLQPLCHFLDDPLADQNICRMGLLEYTPDNLTPAYRDLDHHTLSSILSGDVITKESVPCGRIVIIEDLSRDIVQMLGSCLNIDPLFFASHIGHDGRPESSNVSRALKPEKQSFVSSQYHRAITLQNWQQSLSSSTQHFRRTNVNREVVLLPPTDDSKCNALVQHRCSIFMKHNSVGSWLGLVLVDPSIHNDTLILRQESDLKHLTSTRTPCHLFEGGYEDFLDFDPSFSEGSSSWPSRRGLFEDLIYYWKAERPPDFNISKPSTLSLTYHSTQIIASEWTNCLAAIDLTIKHHENIVGGLPSQPNHLPALENSGPDLQQLMIWHRRMRSYIAQVSQTHHFLTLQEKTPIDVLQTYETITAILTQLSSTLSNTLIPTAATISQVLELKRTESQAFRVNQLTYLAFGFVPLSFVTGLYGMSDDFAPGGENFWQWFVVAIPLSIFCLWSMESSTRPDGLLRRCQDRVDQRNERLRLLKEKR